MAVSSAPQSASSPGMPTLPDKASAAPPKVSGDGNADFEDVSQQEDKLPLHEDVMQLARVGELGSIQKLFDEGKVDAKFGDKEGITPLHVSQYILQKFQVGQRGNVTVPVGSYQQPLRCMQIPHRCWVRRQRKGGRFRCSTCYMGRA